MSRVLLLPIESRIMGRGQSSTVGWLRQGGPTPKSVLRKLHLNMFVLENPVLQRELLVNLRMARAFVLLLLYQALLGAVVYFAWPQDTRLDLTAGSGSVAQTKRLVDLFFVGQFVLASMMAPSFAAGSITGEKERK